MSNATADSASKASTRSVFFRARPKVFTIIGTNPNSNLSDLSTIGAPSRPRCPQVGAPAVGTSARCVSWTAAIRATRFCGCARPEMASRFPFDCRRSAQQLSKCVTERCAAYGASMRRSSRWLPMPLIGRKSRVSRAIWGNVGFAYCRRGARAGVYRTISMQCELPHKTVPPKRWRASKKPRFRGRAKCRRLWMGVWNAAKAASMPAHRRSWA